MRNIPPAIIGRTLLVISGAAAFPCHAHAPELHAPGGGLAWSDDPFVTLMLALAAVLYAAGFLRLARRSQHGVGALRWKGMLFAWGMFMAVAALLSPVDTLGEELFSMHMVQHELLMLAAAPLLVASRPLPVFLWAFTPVARRRIVRGLCGGPVRRMWNVLHAPSVAWLQHALILWAWHFPTLFQASLANRWVHTLQHCCFLASALLFWSALAGAPGRRIDSGAGLAYLLTTAIHTGMLGALLTFAGTVWYPAYLPTTAHWGLAPLEDQQLGGLVMWVPAGFVFIGAGIAAVRRLLDATASAARAEG